MMQRCRRNRSQPHSFSTLARGDEPSSRRYVDVRHHARLPRPSSISACNQMVNRGAFSRVMLNNPPLTLEGLGHSVIKVPLITGKCSLWSCRLPSHRLKHPRAGKDEKYATTFRVVKMLDHPLNRRATWGLC